jgi:hypothetical protein
MHHNIKKQQHFWNREFTIFLKDEQSQSVIIFILVSGFLKGPQPRKWLIGAIMFLTYGNI